MKFPCPECERPLAPDLDWQYCPFCGSLLHHSSRVGEWSGIAAYGTFGAASFTADELMRRGITTRIRAQTRELTGEFLHVVDVSAEAAEDAKASLAEIERAWHDEEQDAEPPLHPLVEKAASGMMGTAVFVVVGIFLLGLLLGAASCVDQDLFRQ